MGKKKSVIRKAGALFLCGSAAVAAGGSMVLASYIVHGKRQSLADSYLWQQSHYDISWFGKIQKRDYNIMSYDGYVLHTTLCRSPEPGNKYVILTHGYTDNRYGMLKYMQIYLDRGYNCIIYDLRGHGENERTYCSYGLREGKDLCQVIRDTFVRYGEDIYLGLHGESLGSATTIYSLEYQQDVKFAVADCGFSDIYNVLEGGLKQYHLPVETLLFASAAAKMRYGFSFKEPRPVDALKNNTVPICFIHGENDKFILPENSARMYQETRGYKELHLIPKAVHANSVLTDRALYTKVVNDFLDQIAKDGE